MADCRAHFPRIGWAVCSASPPPWHTLPVLSSIPSCLGPLQCPYEQMYRVSTCKPVFAFTSALNSLFLLLSVSPQVKALKAGKSVEKPIYNHVSGNLDAPETTTSPDVSRVARGFMLGRFVCQAAKRWCQLYKGLWSRLLICYSTDVPKLAGMAASQGIVTMSLCQSSLGYQCGWCLDTSSLPQPITICSHSRQSIDCHKFLSPAYGCSKHK